VNFKEVRAGLPPGSTRHLRHLLWNNRPEAPLDRLKGQPLVEILAKDGKARARRLEQLACGQESLCFWPFIASLQSQKEANHCKNSCQTLHLPPLYQFNCPREAPVIVPDWPVLDLSLAWVLGSHHPAALPLPSPNNPPPPNSPPQRQENTQPGQAKNRYRRSKAL